MTAIEFSSKVVTEYVDLDKFLQDQGVPTGNDRYERRPLLERVKELLQRAAAVERLERLERWQP